MVDSIAVHHFLLIWVKISVIWYDSPSPQASRPLLDHLYPFGTAPNLGGPRILPSLLCAYYIQGSSSAVPESFHQALHILYSGPLLGGPRILSSSFAHIIFRAPPRWSPNPFIKLCTYYIQGPSLAVPESFITLRIICRPLLGGPLTDRFAHIIFRASPRLSPNCFVRCFFWARFSPCPRAPAPFYLWSVGLKSSGSSRPISAALIETVTSCHSYDMFSCQ
jgi:hypothetical protein